MNHSALGGLVALLSLALGLTRPALAEDAAPQAPPDTRLYLHDLSIIRLGPLGLETQNRLVFQKRLMDSDSALFRDTYVNGAAALKLNPAYFKVGPTVDIQPIALLNVRLGYEYMRFFGGFGYLQSFSEPELLADGTSPFEKSIRDANSDAELNYVTSGHHMFVEPTFQIKVSKVAIRSKTAIERWRMALDDMDGDGQTDTVFYDATLHTLVPAAGMVVTNDSDLLYVSGKHLTAGARYSVVSPKYEGDAMDGGVMKLGPIVAWTFNTRDYSSFNKPTLLFIGGWYLKHPNEVERSFPYLLLGYSFSSDFLNKG